MGYYDCYAPDAFKEGLYTWEKMGKYGIVIAVQVRPMKSIHVHIGVGYEKHRRTNPTRLSLYLTMQGFKIDLIGNGYNDDYPYFHGRGMATCAMNTGIQFALPFYKKPEDCDAWGDVAYVDDQGESEELKKNWVKNEEDSGEDSD